MTDQAELLQKVRAALAPETDVVEKRMFGSIGFVVGGALRVGVRSVVDPLSGQAMMARVGAARVPEALMLPGVRPAVMGGRVMRNWVFLLEDAVATREQVAHWVALAMAATT